MRLLLLIACSALAWTAEQTLLWRNPGPIQSLDLATGPGGRFPVAPYTFVKEETTGVNPKVVVTDGRGTKWMVKFGNEAKAEIFASRISWAAGYPVRSSYFVKAGRIAGLPKSNRLSKVLSSGGAFRDARFQIFDNASFRQVPGPELNLADKRDDQRELNGLKLALLLVANWDVKMSNTAVFETGGERYSAVSDWGGSMGDPAAVDPTERKWDCQGFKRQTGTLMGGVENGFVQFNYSQYSSRHEGALSNGIRVEDMQWFMNRMGRLTDRQVRAALQAAGATPTEAQCFTGAIRDRLNRFRDVTKSMPQTVTRTTTTKRIVRSR